MFCVFAGDLAGDLSVGDLCGDRFAVPFISDAGFIDLRAGSGLGEGVGLMALCCFADLLLFVASFNQSRVYQNPFNQTPSN